MKVTYVNCPICGDCDMRREEDPEGEGATIDCTNLACGSNGGDNFSAVPPIMRTINDRQLNTLRHIANLATGALSPEG